MLEAKAFFAFISVRTYNQTCPRDFTASNSFGIDVGLGDLDLRLIYEQ